MFSRIGNLIYRSSESKNSASYVNRQSLNLTLDPSGTDFVEYSTNSGYFTEAHSLIPNSESQTTTTALKLQDSATNNLFLSTLGDFTLCVKHKLNASSTSSDLLSHYFSNPQYDISFAEPYIRENSPFNVIVSKASNGPVEYEVSGNLITSDLTSGDISGNVYTVESILPFTLNTGTGGNDFVFSLKNLDVSLNAYIYSQYYVASSTNILGETVFAFSPTGTEGTYNNQLDLSFGANSKMIFNVSDNTMTDISLVFGTTVDDSTSINESVVTRTNDLVILDISAGYDGERLVYFEDSSAGMGYVQLVTTTTVMNPNIFNNVTNPTFYWDFREITNNTFVTDLIDGIIKASAKGNLSFNDSTGATFNSTDYIQIDPFTFGGKCSVEVYFKVTNFTSFQRVIDFGQGADDDNFIILSRWRDIFPTTIAFSSRNGSSDSNSQGSAISADTWYHVVVTVDANTNANVIVYLNKNKNINISNVTVPNEERISNLVGWDNWDGAGYMDGQIAYVRIWQDHTLTQTEINNLYNTKDYEVFVDVDIVAESYTVDVSNNSLFRLDSGDGNGFVEKPAIDFANNSGTTYIFDQSHESNANNTLVIGTAPDISSSIVSSGLTIMGTPGQAGAYTKYVSDGSTVYYFSYQSENMGEEPPMYTVKVVDHEVTGEKVFSFKAPGGTFINQPDLSFGAGDRYQFDVRDDTMADISLVFGTTVDDINTRNESVVSRYEGMILLDISAGYDGDRLVYFEDSSAGMGYTSMPSPSNNNLNTIFNEVTQPSFYWDFRTTTPENDGTNEYVTDIIGNSLKAVAYGTSFDNLDGPDLSYNKYLQIDPFTFGQPCSIEVYYNIHSFNPAGRIFDFGKGGATGNTASLDDIIILYDVGENITTFVSFDNSSISSKTGTSTVYNTWEHGILTVDPTSKLKLYRNKNEDLSYNTNTLDVVERTVNYIGRDHFNGGTESLDGQVAFVRVWNGHILTSTEISNLFDTKDTVYVSSSVETYTVTVADDPAAFYLNNEKTPAITFNDNTTYVFDQSHESNANNTLVIGSFDVSSSIVSSGLTIVGTPGQPGAYTKYVSNGSTVHYFSYQTSNMGYNPTP